MRLSDRDVRIDEAALRDGADVPAGTVTLRAPDGAGEAIAHPAAVSLPRVLELAGVAPAALSFVSVRRPNGSLLTLRPPDLAPPPLMWLDADSVRFLRPVRDAADANAADNIATAGDDLIVRVHQGPLLEVDVRVAPQRPRAGERVQLEARVHGASPDAAVSVRWRLGDGSEAGGGAVSHRWRRAGVYAVVASAEGDDDSGGASEPVVVRVGEPRGRPGRHGGGRGDPDRAPAFGQSEPPGSDESVSAQPDRSTSGPSDQSSSSVSVQPSSGASHRSSPSGSDPPTPAQSRSSAPQSRADDSPRGARARAARPDSQPAGVSVRGVLVAATVPAATPAGAVAAPAVARRGESPGERDATLAAGGALAAALMLLGAWRERRRA